MQKEYKELADYMVARFVNKSSVDWIGAGWQIVDNCNLWGSGAISKLQTAIYDSLRNASKNKIEYTDSHGNTVIFSVIDKSPRFHKSKTGGWRNANLYQLQKI